MDFAADQTTRDDSETSLKCEAELIVLTNSHHFLAPRDLHKIPIRSKASMDEGDDTIDMSTFEENLQNFTNAFEEPSYKKLSDIGRSSSERIISNRTVTRRRSYSKPSVPSRNPQASSSGNSNATSDDESCQSPSGRPKLLRKSFVFSKTEPEHQAAVEKMIKQEHDIYRSADPSAVNSRRSSRSNSVASSSVSTRLNSPRQTFDSGIFPQIPSAEKPRSLSKEDALDKHLVDCLAAARKLDKSLASPSPVISGSPKALSTVENSFIPVVMTRERDIEECMSTAKICDKTGLDKTRRSISDFDQFLRKGSQPEHSGSDITQRVEDQHLSACMAISRGRYKVHGSQSKLEQPLTHCEKALFRRYVYAISLSMYVLTFMVYLVR